MSAFSSDHDFPSLSAATGRLQSTYSDDVIMSTLTNHNDSDMPAASPAASGVSLSLSDTTEFAVRANNTTADWIAAYETAEEEKAFENVVRIVVPVIFSLIALLGFVGNLSVIVVVIANRNMRSTTNILIIGLALADLVFIVVCVPFTALNYVVFVWPFGSVWCKIYQYVVHVTAHASVYTLVLMSLDRYMAVVHPIRSMTVRTQRNAVMALIASWSVICAANSPMLEDFELYSFEHGELNRTTCLDVKLLDGTNFPYHGRVFYGTFFAFAFVIPLTTVCILYGCMVRRLRRKSTATPSSAARSAALIDCSSAASETSTCVGSAAAGGGKKTKKKVPESLRAKRRVTRMVIIVVVVFAVCWLPLQVIFMIDHFGQDTEIAYTPGFVAAKIFANCLAYMNSCVNPILYAFLSDNFRKGFRRLIGCVDGSGFAPLKKMDVERTTAPAGRSGNRAGQTVGCGKGAMLLGSRSTPATTGNTQIVAAETAANATKETVSSDTRVPLMSSTKATERAERNGDCSSDRSV